MGSALSSLWPSNQLESPLMNGPAAAACPGDGGLFSFETILCCCGRPMHLGCHAVIPSDYFEDISYDAATWALRRRQQEERSEVASDDANVNDGDGHIFDNRLVGRLSVKLGASPRACRASLCIRRVYDWPTRLSAMQAQLLSSMTEVHWKRFLRTIPSRLCADVMLRRRDDNRMLARVFCRLASCRRANRRSNKFKILREAVQINANGRVYMERPAHSHRLRGSPRRRMTCIGKCSWTRPMRAQDAVAVLVESVDDGRLFVDGREA